MTEALSLGLHAMKYLGNEPEGLVRARIMARDLGFSEAHLAKVLQALARARLVRSTRGPAGGFRLARAAGRIPLLEIVTAIDGRTYEPGCPFKLRVCRKRPCILGRKLARLCEDLEKFLSRTTLKDFMVQPPLPGRVR